MLSGGIEGALVDTELLAYEDFSQAPVAAEVAFLEEAHRTVLLDLSGSADPHPKMQSDLLEGLAMRELVFVDEDLKDYQQVVADLQGSDSSRNVEVVAPESDRNGIEQVSEILSERSNLTAVHFITHGADGQINLGNTWLTSTTLQQNIEAISAWGNALTESGDLLFYGGQSTQARSTIRPWRSSSLSSTAARVDSCSYWRGSRGPRSSHASPRAVASG